MSATLAGALKAYLESKNLGIAVYDSAPPTKATLPYVIVTEGIALTMDPAEDGGPATGAEATGVELVQLDLYQVWRDDSDKRIESINLPDAISKVLHGTALGNNGTGIPPDRVYGIWVKNRIRLLIRDDRQVRHTYDLDVHRVIG